MLNINNLKNRGNNLSLDLQVRNIIRRQSLANNGVWYDPSDLSTLFQDAAGTTPVTAVEQPVGLMLDKSKGLVLGPELVTNGGFDADTAWTKDAGWTISGGKAVATNVANGYSVYQSAAVTPGKWYKITFTISDYASGSVFASFFDGDNGPSYSANGTYTSYIRAFNTRGFVGFAAATSGTTLSVDNITVREIPGNHAIQSTAGYKPLLQSESGRNYLAFDGLDDFLVTGNIDFSSSDKIAVAAGVRKLSDAAPGILCEFSANASANNGAFALLMPNSAGGNNSDWYVRGTIGVSRSYSGLASPKSFVSSCFGNISKPLTQQSINGVPLSSAASLGSGNFQTYPLYIGRRGGTSTPFNGRLYGLVVCGGMDDIYKLKKIEQYLAKKTGVII